MDDGLASNFETGLGPRRGVTYPERVGNSDDEVIGEQVRGGSRTVSHPAGPTPKLKHLPRERYVHSVMCTALCARCYSHGVTRTVLFTQCRWHTLAVTSVDVSGNQVLTTSGFGSFTRHVAEVAIEDRSQ